MEQHKIMPQARRDLILTTKAVNRQTAILLNVTVTMLCKISKILFLFEYREDAGIPIWNIVDITIY